MPILKLDRHDEDKEIEFELDYLTSLTTQQRFEMMFQKREEILGMLSSATGKRNERRKTTEIIKKYLGKSKLVIVTSAMKGITDELINFYNATRLVFESWFIDDTPIDGNPVAVIVNKSFQVSYEYQKQYFLRIESEYGNVTGSGWYDDGTKAVIDIFPLEIEITHLRVVERSVVFVGWKGDVESSYPHIIITMDSPKIIEAE